MLEQSEDIKRAEDHLTPEQSELTQERFDKFKLDLFSFKTQFNKILEEERQLSAHLETVQS